MLAGRPTIERPPRPPRWAVALCAARVFPELRKRQVRSAYVHIPFCRQRCRYCDFAIDVPRASQFEGRVERYVDGLVQEIECAGAGAFEQDFEARPLKTLYFGGGTPSLLPLRHFRRLFDALRRRYGFESDCEVTVEMDPGTFTEETVEELVPWWPHCVPIFGPLGSESR